VLELPPLSLSNAKWTRWEALNGPGRWIDYYNHSVQKPGKRVAFSGSAFCVPIFLVEKFVTKAYVLLNVRLRL
jgi:hypothetical protein